MDELYDFQNGPTFQRHPYPSEWRNEIPRGLSNANETEPSSVLLNTHKRSTPSSVRSPPLHEFHELRSESQSRVQSHSSPTISDTSPCSPKRQKTLDSIPITNSFPLPYKPPSASHLTSTELPRTTVSLTSQEIYSYQSTPFQDYTGRVVHGYESDRLAKPTNFHDSRFFSSSVTTGSYSTWNSTRPDSRPQDRIHCGPVNGYRRAPLDRQHAPRSDLSHPSKDLSLSPGNSTKSFDTHTSRLHGNLCTDERHPGSNQVGEALYLANYPLPSKFPDDDYDDQAFFVPPRGVATCASKYISALDSNESIPPIRETSYWPEMSHDPIFHDLSGESPVVSIEELVARRNRILKDHILSRPTMNEKGTQTDFEGPSPIISRPPFDRDMDLSMDHQRTLSDSTTSQVAEVVEATRPHIFQSNFRRENNTFPRRKPYGAAKYRRSDKNTYSDTSASRPRHKMQNLKRPRSATEDYEDLFDRPETSMNISPRLRDASVYSRRW